MCLTITTHRDRLKSSQPALITEQIWMFAWLIAPVAALACLFLLAGWLWLPDRQRTERDRGLAELADMHWRDFAHIVRRALMEKRGLQPLAIADEGGGEPSSDWLMQHEGRRLLVSCKHGLSYRIAEAAVVELGTKIHLAGADGGLLLTQGQVAREGRELAARQRIEIIDGAALWALLRPYLAAELENSAVEHARRTAIRRTGIAALGCLALGLVIGVSLGDGQPAAVPLRSPATAAPVIAPAADAPRAGPEDADALDAASWQVDGVDIRVENPDPQMLRLYQQQVSRLLASTEGLHSAIWMTQTTITVDRAVDEVQAMALICPVLHRYPSLRTVRVQLNPRVGTEERVRWRQCSTN